MKTILLAMLMLICISCDKGETPIPDFHRTYQMEYKEISPEGYIRTKEVQIQLSIINSELHLLFQGPASPGNYWFTRKYFTVSNDDIQIYENTLERGYLAGKFFKGYGERSYFRHESTSGYVTTLIEKP